jgi:peptide deformylase
MLDIVITPAPVLVKKAENVKKFDNELLSLIAQMTETLLATHDPKGVGLAAPQVGASLRIFQMKPTDKSKVTTYINPVVTNISDTPNPYTGNSARLEKAKKAGKGKKPDEKKLLEGCLSIPNIWGNVTRKRELALEWQDAAGKRYKKTFSGFPAIIIQHEVDHLNGILFTKHVMEQNEKLYRSSKNEEGEDEFEEISI